MQITRSGRTKGMRMLHDELRIASSKFGLAIIDLERMAEALSRSATITAEEMRKVGERLNNIYGIQPPVLNAQSPTDPNKRRYKINRFK